ncbi:hypothetical protein MSAN_02114100 [Mycena sanguinolenta]|uniref:Uncharacterized protein n=1 Tax=Mycena sanguinolenta TaxID=230812 RepID=A0A8H6XI02_9AGAR|nr:hypothetical protein MSAN_02114100 [Mycena sanguinolenta]
MCIPDGSEDQGARGGKQVLPKQFPTATNVFSGFESDEEGDEGEEDEELEPLIAPSTDIKADFEDVLKNGFDFDGIFAFAKRYKMGDAPNPCLSIDGLGTIGIPLGIREARAIIAASKPVRRTENDTKTSGIWELPSKKVHFKNPAWDTWIQTKAGEQASTALTGDADFKPSFILKKLVIHDQSSQTTHHKEPINDDESNRKIGDFIVILPSQFEGAQLQLHHEGQVKILNFARKSELWTSIVAAYSGVEHTLAGVTSGYRLSLVYSLVQPITHVGYRPILPEMRGAVQKLQHILRSWKQMSPDEAPTLLAPLLQYDYSLTNFSAKSLTGSDALLLSYLYPLARELKFRVYLAHVKVAVSTRSAAKDSDYRRSRRFAYDGCEDFDPYDYFDDNELEFLGDYHTREEASRVVVTETMDLRGMPVTVALDLHSEALNGSVTDRDPQFERYNHTSSMRIRVYPRAVLLIWPKGSNTDLSVSVGDIYHYVCNALQSSQTVSPTDREKKLIDRLLQCCHTLSKSPVQEFEKRCNQTKLKTTVRVLGESAARWNDAQVLLRTLKACGVDKNADLMGLEGFASAYQTFEWDVLEDFYGQVIANDKSNARRRALLDRLTEIGAEHKDAEVVSWCKDQADRMLRSLGKVDAAQIPWLVDLGLSRGGEFLRDVIFPQLCAQKLDQTFWMSFLQQIKQNIDAIPATSPDVADGLIVDCVTQTVRSLPAFPTKDIEPSYLWKPARQEKNSDAILEVIALCIDIKTEPLCAEIFTNMRDGARRGVYSPSFPPWLYYADLYPPLVQYTQDAAALDAIFRPFFVDVIDSMVSAARQSPDGKPIIPCPLTDAHKCVIMNAARKAGGITILKERMTAATLKGHDSRTIQALVHTIREEFPRKELQEGVPRQAYDDLIKALVRLAIDTFNTSSLCKKPYLSADKMLKMLKFCFKVGEKNQSRRLLLRFVPPPNGSTKKAHVSGVLAPFVSVLGQYLLSQRLDFQTEPYTRFAAAVIEAFAEVVMGEKPIEPVPIALRQTIGCQSCEECDKLKSFFLSDAPTIRLSPAPGGVTWETLKNGSPHTLLVKKPPSMTAVARWRANSQAGKTLLQELGDIATQARILGAAYPVVYARIHGEEAPLVPHGPMPVANASQILNAPKRRAAADVPIAASVSKKPRIS